MFASGHQKNIVGIIISILKKLLVGEDFLIMTRLSVVFRYTYRKIFFLYNNQDRKKNET